jgi:peptidyl-prolyl cis-trans isomerase SurA
MLKHHYRIKVNKIMKKYNFVLALIIFCSSLSFGQKEELLLTIGNTKVYADEFKYIYTKNNTTQTGKKAPEDYLDLFINYKLFVTEAEALKMDSSKQFQNELEGYRQQLARPFLTESKVYEDLLQEAYKNSKTDIKFDLIYIKSDPNASEKQKENILKKAEKIRKRIIDGENFYKVAQETSDQKSVARNQGKYNFTPLSGLPYSLQKYFADADKKQVSQAIQTPFGYYIVRLQDKRPNPGTVQTAHIMLMLDANADSAAVEAKKQKADSIWQRLNAGESFEALAEKESEDRVSAKKGGAMRPFSTGRMVPAFEEAAFALENIGDYSKPVRTRVGFHIIKLLDKNPPVDFEAVSDQLRRKIDTDPERRELVENKTRELLKEKFNFNENTNNKYHLLGQLDSSVYKANWQYTDEPELSDVIFKADGKAFTLRDFADYLVLNQKKQHPVKLENYYDRQYKRFIYNSLSELEMNNLKKNNPKYANIIKEYHDGMLLFEYKNKFIWEKASQDTIALRKFYKKNKSKFHNNLLLELSVFEYADEKIADRFLRIGNDGFDKMTNDEIADRVGKRNEELKLVISGEYQKGDNEIADKVFDVFEENPSFKNRETLELPADKLLVYIRDRKKAEAKPFEAIKGTVISEFQNYLEKQKLQELKEKYPVEINKQVLNKIEKSL